MLAAYVAQRTGKPAGEIDRERRFDRLRARRADAIAASSEEVVARYERYLRMFAYSMELGAFTLLRLTMRRIDLPGRW